MMNLTNPATTTYEQIILDKQSVPLIEGTTMKVVELVMAQKAHGWSPEELHFQHPYLSMSQIHSALAYYWEHKEVLDADIKRREQYAEEMRQEAGPSPNNRPLCTRPGINCQSCFDNLQRFFHPLHQQRQIVLYKIFLCLLPL
jgi:uncharacterized protein (DUF433 family)